MTKEAEKKAVTGGTNQKTGAAPAGKTVTSPAGKAPASPASKAAASPAGRAGAQAVRGSSTTGESAYRNMYMPFSIYDY